MFHVLLLLFLGISLVIMLGDECSIIKHCIEGLEWN